MAVKLRLARHGASNHPFYWLVAANSRFARDGRYLEKLGTYNPILPKDNAERLKINQERIKYWLSVGAQPSERVIKLLDLMKIADIEKFKNKKKSTIGTPKTTKNPDKRKNTKNQQEQTVSKDAGSTEESAPETNAAVEQQITSTDNSAEQQKQPENTAVEQPEQGEKEAENTAPEDKSADSEPTSK